MLTPGQVSEARTRAVAMLAGAGVALRPDERDRIEVADFGLSELEVTGLEVLVYVNSERYCAKELVLFPRQTCPQHRHPPVGALPGKEETFRCRWGEVYLYLPGASTAERHAVIPPGSEAYYTAQAERVMRPGDQVTIPPDTPHWFQAGPLGAVVTEFSSHSTDENDVFFDPRVRRVSEVVRP